MSVVIAPEITDRARRGAAIARLKQVGGFLPTWSDLADPDTATDGKAPDLTRIDPDAPDAANLWRVHWFNTADRKSRMKTPMHAVLPPELTGVKAPIVVLDGCSFPMIGAHKVLAAYACLVARLVTGSFDPSHQRAIWPSTGNYCRGGVAISRILGCRGVAVLPAGMSRERFDWLQRWVADPSDIIRTPGTESNVKEIYDECAKLARDPDNVILNQFSEFANYLVHYHCTGRAFDRVFGQLQKGNKDYRLAAFVSATGSAGTIAAGDWLKKQHHSRIVAVEAAECPTMLCNGYGEHNIQGIGDKHIPLIHNVMNTDVVIAVSDASTDALNLLFGDDRGRKYLTARRKIDPALVRRFDDFGISGLANIVAAIKLAKHLDYGRNDVVMTVATDSAAMYGSEREAYRARKYPDGFDEVNAGEIFGRHMEGIADDRVLELTHTERSRIFNLGYYTWVEQQGVSVEDFDRRRKQEFWRGLTDTIPAWDRQIEDFNAEIGRNTPGMSEVKSYEKLRQDLARRDRSLREKVVGLDDVASFVRDGDVVGLGGSTLSRTPMALVWALIRARRQKLTCTRSITSSDGDLLFGSGVCEHIVTSWFSQSILWGVSKVMRHYVETGKARFEEWSHMAMGMRLRAGAMGVPFMPIRAMLGSDVLKQRPEAKEIDCPFTGEKLLLVPALNPDVALIHVQRCDAYGNAQIDGLQFMDIDLAMAANKVILSTERIVSNDQIRRAPDRTKIAFFAVDAVVEVPFGCAPHECYGVYEPSMKHLEFYVDLVNKDPVGGMKTYLDRFVYGPRSWPDFLDLIGIAELISAARAGTSIYDA